jgi:FAD/FMN-containing dehydrogenase
MESYYGDNKDRLIEIKTEYDPYNIFKYKQSIPPL